MEAHGLAAAMLDPAPWEAAAQGLPVTEFAEGVEEELVVLLFVALLLDAVALLSPHGFGIALPLAPASNCCRLLLAAVGVGLFRIDSSKGDCTSLYMELRAANPPGIFSMLLMAKS